MQQITNKKGQSLGGLGGSIIAIVVAVIILVMGLIMVQEFRETDTLRKANSASYSNETQTTLTQDFQALVASSNPGCQASLVNVYNKTGAYLAIETANFTLDGCRVRFANTGGVLYNNSDVNFTYVITYGDEAYVGANSSLSGLGDFSDFIPLIVIALAASVIIGLILSGFAFRNRNR